MDEVTSGAAPARRAMLLLRALEDDSEGPGIVTTMRKHCKSLTLVELLLICGVNGDAVVSTIAFGILRALLYPPPCALNVSEILHTIVINDEVVNGEVYVWENAALVELVDRYAKGFEFTQNPTPQMIAAFPLFWNHRYVGPDDEPGPPITIELDRRYTFEKPAGKTPLEFYSYCLLEDPPENDVFSLSILEVLKWKLNAIRDKRDSWTEDLDFESRCEVVMREDEVFFNFLRSNFLMADTVRADLTKLEEFLVIAPHSKERGNSATAINGYAFALARLIADWDAFTCAGHMTPMFYAAPIVVTPAAGKHITEVRALMKKFREGRVKVGTDWDLVRESSPPPIDK
jgi:hypothetical protein